MRPVKALDRSDLWFGAVVAALFVLASLTLFAPITTDSGFWVRVILPWLPFWIITSVMRGPLRELKRVPRFVCCFCIGVTGAVFFLLARGEQLTLAIAAGSGLGLAVLDALLEYFDRKRETENA
jgi:hypothetical protein